MTDKLYNLARIRDLLLNGFDDQELRWLCHDVPEFRPVHDSLAGNTGKGQIVDRLLEFANRRMMIGDLLTLAQELNPARYEHHGPYHAGSPSSASPEHELRSAQPEGAIPHGRSADSVQITLSMDIRDFDSRTKKLLIYGLSGFLEIPPEEVGIVVVQSGSVKVVVELPLTGSVSMLSRNEVAWAKLERHLEKTLEMPRGVQLVQVTVRNLRELDKGIRRAPRRGLERYEGIGPIYAEKLADAGIRTAEALLEEGSTPKGRKELAERSGISQRLILEWVDHIDLFRIKGVGEEYSDLLEEAGVDTVPELAQRNAADLYAKLAEVNEAKKLVRRLPAQSKVADWIEQAKALPRVVTY